MSAEPLSRRMREFAAEVRNAGFSEKLDGAESSVLYDAADALDDAAAVVAERLE